jgi:hypothetical protein
VTEADMPPPERPKRARRYGEQEHLQEDAGESERREEDKGPIEKAQDKLTGR